MMFGIKPSLTYIAQKKELLFIQHGRLVHLIATTNATDSASISELCLYLLIFILNLLAVWGWWPGFSLGTGTETISQPAPAATIM